MTDQTMPQMPPLDPGNPILAEAQAILSCTPVNGPGGQRLAMTIRTATTTLTIFLAKDDAGRWRDTMSDGIAKMNGLIVPMSLNSNGNGS